MGDSLRGDAVDECLDEKRDMFPYTTAGGVVRYLKLSIQLPYKGEKQSPVSYAEKRPLKAHDVLSRLPRGIQTYRIFPGRYWRRPCCIGRAPTNRSRSSCRTSTGFGPNVKGNCWTYSSVSITSNKTYRNRRTRFATNALV